MFSITSNKRRRLLASESEWNLAAQLSAMHHVRSHYIVAMALDELTSRISTTLRLHVHLGEPFHNNPDFAFVLDSMKRHLQSLLPDIIREIASNGFVIVLREAERDLSRISLTGWDIWPTIVDTSQRQINVTVRKRPDSNQRQYALWIAQTRTHLSYKHRRIQSRRFDVIEEQGHVPVDGQMQSRLSVLTMPLAHFETKERANVRAIHTQAMTTIVSENTPPERDGKQRGAALRDQLNPGVDEYDQFAGAFPVIEGEIIRNMPPEEKINDLMINRTSTTMSSSSSSIPNHNLDAAFGYWSRSAGSLREQVADIGTAIMSSSAAAAAITNPLVMDDSYDTVRHIAMPPGRVHRAMRPPMEPRDMIAESVVFRRYVHVALGIRGSGCESERNDRDATTIRTRKRRRDRTADARALSRSPNYDNAMFDRWRDELQRILTVILQTTLNASDLLRCVQEKWLRYELKHLAMEKRDAMNGDDDHHHLDTKCHYAAKEAELRGSVRAYVMLLRLLNDDDYDDDDDKHDSQDTK